MKVRRFLLPLVAVAAAWPLFLSAMPASAAPSHATDRPVVSELPATIGEGAVLNTDTDSSCGHNNYWSWLDPAALNWDGSDATSGIDHYTFTRRLDEGPNVGWHSIGTRTSQPVGQIGDYSGDCGGPPDAYAHSAVRAFNGAGARTQLYLGYMSLCVIQQDGYTPGSCNPGGAQTPRYHGQWSATASPDWSHGTAARTATAHGRATFTHDFAGEQLGLVMARGPHRGRVHIYIDGVLRRTLDNYAPSPVNHTIAWTVRPKNGTHTIRVVNEATAGRASSVFDAVVYLYS
jgi:hypothetical protein